ncbi:hypothetical protein NDU88_008789 [Pleurodeles waltl]|uniref:Uncharacterized protein n=1 Tax=Pleurodeles waltl TaxID=8319 RepID=A0AAV7N608_PLEWA|nr:hypothetical protein NDU88_008789 [Pleurodeles waltl]
MLYAYQDPEIFNLILCGDPDGAETWGEWHQLIFSPVRSGDVTCGRYSPGCERQLYGAVNVPHPAEVPLTCCPRVPNVAVKSRRQSRNAPSPVLKCVAKAMKRAKL